MSALPRHGGDVPVERGSPIHLSPWPTVSAVHPNTSRPRSVSADIPVLREESGRAVPEGTSIRPNHPALYRRTLSAWSTEDDAARNADPETTLVVPEGPRGVHLIVMRS